MCGWGASRECLVPPLAPFPLTAARPQLRRPRPSLHARAMYACAAVVVVVCAWACVCFCVGLRVSSLEVATSRPRLLPI